MSGSAEHPAYLDVALGSFLELVSAAAPAPGGGSAAAVAIGLAAGLCVMSARLSTRQLSDAADLATAAEGLRDRAAALCQADADAYGQFVWTSRDSSPSDPAERGRRIGAALSKATDVPLDVAETGAAVVHLAARLAEHGNPHLLGDAATAAFLAEAGTRAAAALVLVNLEGLGDDARRERVVALRAKSAGNIARVQRLVER